MDFLTTAKSRYSVRSFSPRPVEKEKITGMLEAAQAAPTAHNAQPYVLYVMQSPEAIAQIDACSRNRFGAPLVFVICYDKTQAWSSKEGTTSGPVDCGIVGTHMMFAAHDLGLGSCWVMRFEASVLKQALNMPDYLIPVSLMPVGYPSENAIPSPRHLERKPLLDNVLFK